MTIPGSLRHNDRLASSQAPLILAIVLLVVTVLPWELPEHYALYLPLHSAFEIASSAVAFLIFVVGWLSFQRSAPVSVVLIAVTFLGVALIDVGHLLSYEGMPAMVTPSGPEKGIQFWLAARLLAAIGLALAIIVPRKQKPAPSWLRSVLLAGMLVLVTTVFAAILLAPDSLPDTFDPETGLTAVKIGAEYFVVVVHLLTVGVLWFHHRAIPHIDSRNLATAILVIVLSEVFFTLYVSVTDTFNLLGHVYKIIAYYYLFRAIVVSGIETPYHRLASTQARLKATLEALPDIIFELDRDGVVHQFHSRYPHLLARPDAIEGRCLFDFLPDNATTALKSLITDIHEHGRSETHHYNLEVDGEVRDYEATGNLLQDPTTHSPRYIVIVQDVTQRKHLNHELRIAAAAFESQESICITDADHRILRVNSAFTRITGFEQDEVVGRDPAVLLPEGSRRDFRRRLEQCMERRSRWRGEIQLRRKDGEVHSQLMLVTAVHGEQGAVRNFIYDYIDISALKKAETRIQKLALYDSLTGLGNRHLLEMRLSRAIEESHESRQFGGLLFINLVRFKKINDAMGFSAGDQLLIEIAQELRGLADHLITPFRQGADEFALIIENAGDDATTAGGTVGTLSERVFAALNRAFTINGEEYFNRCRIGGTVFGGETLESGDVLNQAAIAVHQVISDRGRPISFFDPKMQAAVTREQSLESDLRRAISGRQLILHYQPKVDAHRRVIGLEALVRWNHPDRGLLHPGEFIPAAEKSGLIVPIEKWILEQAIAQLARWQQAGTPFSMWSISVNVASSQFYRDEFESQLASLLERYGVQAGRLILEFTESTLLNDVRAAQTRIRRLAEQGIRFSIDDFGTGYSSLAYLGRLPVHELKIDRSFVSDFDKETYNAAIVRMVIEMAHILGMQVVAEGVETEEQYRFLLDEGCDLLQGFRFGRPIPLEEIEMQYESSESDLLRAHLSYKG